MKGLLCSHHSGMPINQTDMCAPLHTEPDEETCSVKCFERGCWDKDVRPICEPFVWAKREEMMGLTVCTSGCTNSWADASCRHEWMNEWHVSAEWRSSLSGVKDRNVWDAPAASALMEELRGHVTDAPLRTDPDYWLSDRLEKWSFNIKMIR